METQDGEDVQRAEKATLKRKLTGPPRLLLGKTRTRSVGEDRPEARTNRDQTGNESSAEADADAAELTETEMNVDVSSGVTVEGSRGRCGAAGEDDDITNRKLNRRRWWRRFAPAVVCSRKQKTNIQESLEKQKNDRPATAEEALQETDAASEEDTENSSKGRRRFNGTAWTVFKRFRTSSNARRGFVEKDGDEPSTTFQKKIRNIFSSGGKKRSSGVPLENMEDTARCEAPPRSAGAPVGSLQVVTVQLTEESPDETPAEDQQLCDAGDGSETVRTDGEDVKDANNVKDEVCCVSTAVVLDAEPETTSQYLLPPTNGPGIRIELVPADDVTQEEEDRRVGGPALVNQNHLLLSFDHSERRLVQTARSLVRAAMNAAVEQLSREQQSESDGVQREPQGCRDHA